MKNSILFTYIIFSAVTLFSANAQDYRNEFKHLTTDDGLSQSFSTCILKDSQGFMWFGTRDGLNKYDGYKFIVYKNDPYNQNSLVNNHVISIAEDTKGNLWIGTDGGGVDCFNKATQNFIHYQHDSKDRNSLSNNSALVVHCSKKGQIWVGTRNGLNLYNPIKRNFKHYIPDTINKNSIHNEWIASICEDKNGIFWIGTDNGVSIYNPTTDKFSRYANEKASKLRINKIIEDNKGNIWLGTHGDGVYVIFEGTKKLLNYRNQPGNTNCLSNNIVLSMVQDLFGHIWMGTENSGISELNITLDKFYYHKQSNNPHSLSQNSIQSLYRDDVGNIWVGTFSGGVNFLDRNRIQFRHITNVFWDPNSLSHKVVKNILEDSQGQLWVTTEGGGLNKLDKAKGNFTNYRYDAQNKSSISSDFLLGLEEDSEGNLWIGSFMEGLNLLKKNTTQFIHFKHDPKKANGLNQPTASIIYEDKRKNLWVGTWGGGLNLFNKTTKTFTSFKLKNGNNFINCIYEDSKENLWIGIKGEGGYIFDRDKLSFSAPFKNAKGDTSSLSNNVINSILEDNQGNIWFGTNNGLNKLINNYKFKTFGEKQGLSNSSIQGILEDTHGNLWISTNKGISKMNIKTNTFRNYTVQDGLQSNEFKPRAAFKSKSGEMYFGGINGYNVFHPDSIKDNMTLPAVYITGLQIFNKPIIYGQADSLLKSHISYTNELNLSYKQSVLSFEFTALNYTLPEKNQYAYKMEGLDKEWNYVGNEKKATYVNLEPGKYIFRVKASNNDGIWNEDGTFIKVVITPPFWKTWWFTSFIALLIIGFAISFYKVRMNIIRAQKRVLEKQVTERTSQLQSANEELQTQGEKLEELFGEVNESIRAAEVIQQSILPSTNYIKEYLPESFILFKPKAVVSGDFYWFGVINDKIILSAVDCTGHGVSGALMAITGHHLLKQAVYSTTELIASDILDRLNDGIIEELHGQKNNDDVQDGMDVAFCIIDKEKQQLQYAGAINPLYICRGEEIIQVKASKFSIGLTINGTARKFTNNCVDLMKGDIVYIFSDGYADQIGGVSGNEKFMYPRFRELLIKNSKESMNMQMQLLEENLSIWRNNTEQLDDVLVIGFKI